MVTHKCLVRIGFAAVLCLVLGGVGWFKDWDRHARPATERSGAASPARVVKVFFAAGLVCEGREQDIPISAWQVTCRSQHLVMTDASPPSAELPVELLGANPLRLTVRVPGWSGALITLPPAAEDGCFYIPDAITLPREMACLDLTMPVVGTDYDMAEVIWLRALDEEPLALPLGRSSFVPLDFHDTKRLAPLPTGIYRCTLKSQDGARIREFDLSPELALHARKDPSAPMVVTLPPSLSRTYVGFAGSAAESGQAGGSTGFFCGINLKLRKNTGELLLAFRPLLREQSVRYSDLKPRPDTVWPISNLFLQDPVSLSFDCPLSHGDYRVVFRAADGQFTAQPELVLPEDGLQKKELFGRMRALIQVQARNAAANPDLFDARYARLPVQQLPNYENLLSFDHFARHLGRLSRIPAKPIELGSQITVRQAGQSSWDVHVDSIYGEPTRH